jgi:glycerol kinase
LNYWDLFLKLKNILNTTMFLPKLMLGKIIIATFIFSALLSVALAPMIANQASARISEGCEKNGNVKEGSCTGNTNKNGKEKVCQNPKGKQVSDNAC